MEIGDVIDRRELSERLDGDMELLIELKDLFLEDSSMLLDNINNAMGKNDSEALRKAAHTIKGSVANFSAKKAYDIAFQLENVGKNNEFIKAGEVFLKLKVEIENLCNTLVKLSKEDSIV